MWSTMRKGLISIIFTSAIVTFTSGRVLFCVPKHEKKKKKEKEKKSEESRFSEI